jgi:hypothetical protein
MQSTTRLSQVSQQLVCIIKILSTIMLFNLNASFIFPGSSIPEHMSNSEACKTDKPHKRCDIPNHVEYFIEKVKL